LTCSYYGRVPRLAAVLAIMATLLAFGCNGSDHTNPQTPTPTPAAATTPLTASPTPSPWAPTAPLDAAGSRDFRDVQRLPNSYIEIWGAGRTIIDCQGEGPIPVYERFEIDYRLPEVEIVPAAQILTFLVDRLLQSGWSVSRSDGFNAMLYRGVNLGSLSYADCNPAGQTDWVSVTVQSDTAGIYTVQLVLPQGIDPY
jgi:hypothetical protein